jgi:SAM-dependent methyltransferase
MSAIHDLFLRLERAGPGDAATLGRAVAGLRPGARVLDAGCGVGADTGALLARGFEVTALEVSEVFGAEVARRHPGARVVVGDMRAPPAGPYDLIWSAGAVYNVGVAAALAAWRGVLAPGGRVAFSDLCKRVEVLPPACAAYWASEGLVLRDAATLEAEVVAAGYRVTGAEWVSDQGWADYYEPLEVALSDCPDADLVAAFRAEIANWRAQGATFGYRMIVCAPEK